MSVSVPLHFYKETFPLQSLTVPNSPTLRVILPRFSSTYLLWTDPEPFVGDITGVQIRYLINGTAKSIPELGGGVRQYTVSGIKDTVGRNHSISLRAKTSAGWGAYSRPIEFTFRPIGEAADMQLSAVHKGACHVV